MNKLQIVELKKKVESKPEPIFNNPCHPESNVKRVTRELRDNQMAEKLENDIAKSAEAKKKLRTRRLLVIRHDRTRDGIHLRHWAEILELNETCKQLAWRLATTPGGKEDPDWFPTFRKLQNARKKRDKRIILQQKEWQLEKEGRNCQAVIDEENSRRGKEMQKKQAAARLARKKALRDAHRLDLLEAEERFFKMQLAAENAKATQWERVEEGRKRFMETHGSALAVQGATSAS